MVGEKRSALPCTIPGLDDRGTGAGRGSGGLGAGGEPGVGQEDGHSSETKGFST